MTNYDIIGDVHGHADALGALLERMSYVHSRGAYRHPSRTAVFVGDHLLRPHDEKSTIQHSATLAEFDARPNLAPDLLGWFATLPLFLDLPGTRIVHACWCRESVAPILPLLIPDGSMSEAVFAAACRYGRRERQARDIRVSGAEIELPAGQSFKNNDTVPVPLCGSNGCCAGMDSCRSRMPALASMTKNGTSCPMPSCRRRPAPLRPLQQADVLRTLRAESHHVASYPAAAK